MTDEIEASDDWSTVRASRRRALVRFFAYVGAIWLVLLIPDTAVRWSLNQILPSWTDYGGLRRQPSLYAKIAQYEAERDDYDLVFIGDSRTFTNIAPDVLDPILGTRSVNLATFGNWFPTQYVSNLEILPRVPRGVPVVWSIGHVNFRQVNEGINPIYHVGFANVPTFLRWGFEASQLWPNLLESVPGLALYTRRALIREHVQRLLARAVLRNEDHAEEAPAPPIEAANYETLISELRKDPDVLDVDVIRDASHATSLAVFYRAGNYVRIEIDPGFFREKQRHFAEEIETLAGDRFEPDPRYWDNFVAILDQFEEHGIRLIVNEFEEAPYHYEDAKNAELYREFMAGVREYVEGRGFDYVRVDFSRFGNDDYFDYNHMNSRGVETFNPMFARALAPLIHGG